MQVAVEAGNIPRKCNHTHIANMPAALGSKLTRRTQKLILPSVNLLTKPSHFKVPRTVVEPHRVVENWLISWAFSWQISCEVSRYQKQSVLGSFLLGNSATSNVVEAIQTRCVYTAAQCWRRSWWEQTQPRFRSGWPSCESRLSSTPACYQLKKN